MSEAPEAGQPAPELSHAALLRRLLDVLGKPHAWTWVVIQEVDTADWGWGGMPVLEYRKQLAGEAE